MALGVIPEQTSGLSLSRLSPLRGTQCSEVEYVVGRKQRSAMPRATRLSPAVFRGVRAAKVRSSRAAETDVGGPTTGSEREDLVVTVTMFVLRRQDVVSRLRLKYAKDQSSNPMRQLPQEWEALVSTSLPQVVVRYFDCHDSRPTIASWNDEALIEQCKGCRLQNTVGEARQRCEAEEPPGNKMNAAKKSGEVWGRRGSEEMLDDRSAVKKTPDELFIDRGGVVECD
ncbi:hypothetical protein BJ546DRAFT_949186 [Cryomyces antarcticus]